MPKNQPVTENDMVVTDSDKGFLLVPVDRSHWIFRGRIVTSSQSLASSNLFTALDHSPGPWQSHGAYYN